jgi:hypothetical protein
MAFIGGRTPTFPEDGEAAFGSMTAMFAMVQRSNHATAFAGWVVCTGATGLAVQSDTIAAAGRGPFGWLLILALLPLLAGGSVVLGLLTRAYGLTAAAQEDFYRFIAETPRDAPELRAPAVRQLQLLTAATRHREMLTRQALRWSYISGIAFVLWSATATALTSGN